MRVGKRGKQAGMGWMGFASREGSPHPEGDGMRWFSLHRDCVCYKSGVGSQIFDFLGFFRLWTVENVVVTGFQLLPGQGINAAQYGVHAVVCAFSRRTSGKKMLFKENYCIAYQLKTKVFCPANHGEALSCQSQGKCFPCTSARLWGFSFSQTSIELVYIYIYYIYCVYIYI